MRALHLTADLYRCRCDSGWLTEAERLGTWCVQAVRAVGWPVVGQWFHGFAPTDRAPGGVMVTVLTADAQLCLRTWLAQQGVTIDVQASKASTDRAAQARALMDALVARLAPEWTEQRSLDRGDDE